MILGLFSDTLNCARIALIGNGDHECGEAKMMWSEIFVTHCKLRASIFWMKTKQI
jgi:hypothetical protein